MFLLIKDQQIAPFKLELNKKMHYLWTKATLSDGMVSCPQ